MNHDFDIAVVGGGLAGLIAALAFAERGFDTALVAPAPDMDKPDGRTTALMDQSIQLLDRLGVWAEIRPFTAPLTTMQIIDGTDRLLRAPTVAFRSTEIGLEAFGYNIPNAPMIEILGRKVAAHDRIKRFESLVDHAEIGPAIADLTLVDGSTLSARLVVSADGRKSVIREAAGISVRTWSYPQTALVLVFDHSVEHHNVSTEFHTPSGPFTQVPLPGRSSSLVWVVRPEDAERLVTLEPSELAIEIEKRMASMLGKISVRGRAQAWPLSGMTANRFGAKTAVLVGEAAHVFPPIGAQGLNLSLRDIIAAVDLAESRLTENGDLAIGETFDSARRADVLARTASVDLLNRSLLSAFLPIQLLRAAGLHVLATVTPLRHVVMREGIQPGQGFGRMSDRLWKKIGRKQA